MLRIYAHTMSSHRQKKVAGFTMIELIVTIAVLSVIMSILVPAVQATRSSARAVHCRNNFRQVSIALQNYVSLSQQIPQTRFHALSSFVQLLPHLENAALYDRLIRRENRVDRSAIRYPAIFRCTEDPGMASMRSGTNIGENVGLCEERTATRLRIREQYNGVFLTSQDSVLRPAGITDGLSNTAAYSEILSYPQPGFQRRMYAQKHDKFSTKPAAEQARSCRSAEVAIGRPMFARGSDWVHGMLQVNQYVHVLPPNERDCLFVPGSASAHRGGVHTCLCDGSVRFVSSSIDEVVWQAIGTRGSSDGPIEW